MKILFSNKKDWKRAISKGFQFTPHEITFGELPACHLQNYDLIVPLTIQDLKYLNEIEELNNPLPIPSVESLTLCDDKYKFSQALIDKGFGKFIPQLNGTLKYPYLVKKRVSTWGEDIQIISSDHQETVFSDIINNPEYYTQEFIPGRNEYATHIFFKDNKVVWAINNKYVFAHEKPIKGKNKPVYTQICRCPYIALFTAILTAIGFNGLCCVNYKVENNTPYIFEINPRFGGSLCPYFFSFLSYFN